MKNFFYFVTISIVIFYSSLNAQWVQTNGPYIGPIECFAVSPNGAGGTNLFAGTGNSGVFLSTDNGTSWTAETIGLTNTVVRALAVSPDGAGGTNLFAGTSSGVFLSTDNGTNWTEINTGLPKLAAVFALAVSGTNIFAGMQSGVFRSTDSGTNWTPTSNGPTGIKALAALGTNLFAGTTNYNFRSTDNGTSWTNIFSPQPYDGVDNFTVSGVNIFAGFWNRIAVSTNNGTSWANVRSQPIVGSQPIYFSNALAVSDNFIFASSNYGVVLNTINGTSWIAVNDGFDGQTYEDSVVTALTVSGTYLFAGTYSGVVWSRPLVEMITDVESEQQLPLNFELKQNYPNPFNPSTKINFSIPQTSFVNLKVYDILGNEIVTLVNEEKPTGSYEVNFKAANLPSGVYLYKLQAGSYTEIKKMMLLK